MGAEADLVVVDGEVDEAAPELEEFFVLVPVALVLLNRIGHRLLGEAVLELEGGDGQAVDEEAEIEGELPVVVAVPELARDAEPVQAVEGRGLVVAGRGGAVEEVEVVGAVVDPVPEHVDGAAARDLAVEAGEELTPGGAVQVEVEQLGGFGLGCAEEGREVGEVDAELAVVVFGVAWEPSDAVARGTFARCGRRSRVTVRGADQRLADEGFQSAFSGVGGHAIAPPSS